MSKRLGGIKGCKYKTFSLPSCLVSRSDTITLGGRVSGQRGRLHGRVLRQGAPCLRGRVSSVITVQSILPVRSMTNSLYSRNATFVLPCPVCCCSVRDPAKWFDTINCTNSIFYTKNP